MSSKKWKKRSLATQGIVKPSSPAQSISRPSTPSVSQSARALSNQSLGTPHISNSKTQPKLKAPKSRPSTATPIRAPVEQRYLAAAAAPHTDIGIRVETTLTQTRKYNPAKSASATATSIKSCFSDPCTSISRLSSAPRTCTPVNHKPHTLAQASGSSSPTCSIATKLKSELPALTYTSASSTRIPALCHDLYSSMPSRADLLCALIHLTLQQLRHLTASVRLLQWR